MRWWRIKLTPKTFFGRLFHGGISRSDLWNVDVFLADKIARAVKRFVEMERHGIPVTMLDRADGAFIVHPDEHDEYIEFYEPIWEAILWKIVDGMERVVADEDYTDYEREAVDLFAEFFFNLWD